MIYKSYSKRNLKCILIVLHYVKLEKLEKIELQIFKLRLIEYKFLRMKNKDIYQKGFSEASELTRNWINNFENKLKESEEILYQQVQPKNHFLDYFQGRQYRKGGMVLIQSWNSIDLISNFNHLQELTINKGIEAVLLKESQKQKE
ncbi:unnamed protein product [Paramecium sonneborni]|uniref:Uncharacterized protein n=1 Tax=Paramecium sonneborni TaxID=65129 RepID=A0A8S1K683_9CILI|nr:unnamed protein product [Paramecium sonneborni]